MLMQSQSTGNNFSKWPRRPFDFDERCLPLLLLLLFEFMPVFPLFESSEGSEGEIDKFNAPPPSVVEVFEFCAEAGKFVEFEVFPEEFDVELSEEFDEGTELIINALLPANMNARPLSILTAFKPTCSKPRVLVALPSIQAQPLCCNAQMRASSFESRHFQSRKQVQEKILVLRLISVPICLKLIESALIKIS